MFPTRVAAGDVEILLKELELTGEGEVSWKEDTDVGTLRVGDSVRVYKKDGDYFEVSWLATDIVELSDQMFGTMLRDSWVRQVLPPQEAKEKTVDKYGVETKKNDPKTKEAADKGACPVCGDALEDTNVPKCPRHGVEPFEEDITGQDVPEE